MKNEVEAILPFAESDTPKSKQIEIMFDKIAVHYDLLNRLMSFGLDKYWRKNSILSLADIAPKQILDIATGTGDLAIEAYKLLHPDMILGVDISANMLEIGRQKVFDAGLSDNIKFDIQNCANLQIPDNSFDAAIVAFGVRNFESLDTCLREILRVLRPSGRLMILELSSPTAFPFKQGYALYTKLIPLLGKLISRNQPAYKYLPESIKHFPEPDAMKELMTQSGFVNVLHKAYTFGVCTMFTGDKQK
ncbi:MAG: bifunctional demethylmenaquinone methyltransferase/2-methoxy-6-polyprenyl-1,4-benzoquinol methylase UbiE [Ignavibacteria bacterium]|jgi:demethylmenaquinone methyltransferase/2-methoxy-6-polyprenyl-1,4-benzoquinol methylase|nr:bifunctional demethylmenaquinone methyltransferase/2-methoxy-6-polyprenyl-1,4-benzoquinol methylase UbiE [Ignavibacteria bacterium]